MGLNGTTAAGNGGGVVFGIRTPPAGRYRSGWLPDHRVADTSTMFGPYIDVLNDMDFSLEKDPLAYDKMMRDCQIRSCAKIRELATASRKLEFVPRTNDKNNPVATEAARFATDMWARVRRPTEVLLNILDAIWRGSSFNECVWKLDKKDLIWYTEGIIPTHKDRFIFSLEGELCLRTPYDIFYGQTVPPRTFIHHIYDPEPATFSRPETESRLYFGVGEFERIYPWFMWKQLVLRLGFVYLDRLAFPIKVGRYPYRDEEARDNTLRFLQDLDHHRVGAWPMGENWDVQIFQTQATGHNVAMDWVAYIDASVAKTLLGTLLVQGAGESGQGSYALGASQIQNVFGALTESDSISLCDTLENTWVKWLFEMNSRPPETAPRCVQATGRNVELTQAVDLMLALSERGYPVSYEQISETTGIRPAREGETLLMVPAQSGAGLSIQGNNGPFDKAKDLVGIGDIAAGKDPKKQFSMRSQKHAIWCDVLPEESVSEADVEKNTRKSSKELIFQPALASRIRRRIGAVKAASIDRCAKALKRVKFTYTDLKKQTKDFDVEPYSYRYRRTFVYLYAYDPVDRTIKSFFAHKIKNVRSGRRFQPRWIVEIGQ